jgi:LmbE family N-acetylglucosaminyl deacetylase
LAGCTQPSTSLTSQAWQPNLKDHSFAYLLTLDKGPAGFPACSLKQATDKYGRPNSSVVLGGSFNDPREILLFYDHGINLPKPSTIPQYAQPATVVPIGLDELTDVNCHVPTIMQIVAHQDDDLLFMNPDLIHDIRAGHCIRTIYLTAGDAGSSQLYWLGRERGSENAYSTMLGTKQTWIERQIRVADNQYVTIANPMGNKRISLIFMHLPDGNIKGQGFAASQFQNLAKLESGKIPQIHTVYSGSSYTLPQLTNTLVQLMLTYQPTEIRTQSSIPGHQYPDHSDHMAVGRIAESAHQQYEQQQYEGYVKIPVRHYMGYPTHEQPADITGEDLAAKQAAFFAYAQFDKAVCDNAIACANNPAYGAYLPRQRQSPH